MKKNWKIGDKYYTVYWSVYVFYPEYAFIRIEECVVESINPYLIGSRRLGTWDKNWNPISELTQDITYGENFETLDEVNSAVAEMTFKSARSANAKRWRVRYKELADLPLIGYRVPVTRTLDQKQLTYRLSEVYGMLFFTPEMVQVEEQDGVLYTTKVWSKAVPIVEKWYDDARKHPRFAGKELVGGKLLDE